jgi:hypothetical protein
LDAAEQANHRHLRLLRARRERPGYGRAAEKRYELAASQFIELHSIPASQGRFAGYRMGTDQSAGIGAAIGTKRQTPSAKRISPAADSFMVRHSL